MVVVKISVVILTPLKDPHVCYPHITQCTHTHAEMGLFSLDTVMVSVLSLSPSALSFPESNTGPSGKSYFSA